MVPLVLLAAAVAWQLVLTGHTLWLAAGAARVVSTDSIPHPSNAISLALALAKHTSPHLRRT